MQEKSLRRAEQRGKQKNKRKNIQEGLKSLEKEAFLGHQKKRKCKEALRRIEQETIPREVK